MLPTPQARDHHGAHNLKQRIARRRPVNLNDLICTLPRASSDTGWGIYTPAIRRWEQILGRSAPPPAEPGRTGTLRISAQFTEWCKGLPDGWITDVASIPYVGQIRTLGNGVVPRQAAYAIARLLSWDKGSYADQVSGQAA